MEKKAQFIHILRGLGALIVMLSHWFTMFFISNATCANLGRFNEITFTKYPFWMGIINHLGHLNLGMLGISIFFIITGYLIVPSLNGGVARFIKKKL